MSTTVTLANMPSSYTDVSVAILDQTKLSLRTARQTEDGLSFSADYVYTDGDPTIETVVAVRINVDVKTGIVRNSIRLSTVSSVVVDSLDPVVTPIDTLVAWNTYGPMADADKVLRMLGSAFSLAFDGVTSKVPNGGIFDAANWKLIHNLYG
jgi:hypothetical protein